MLNQYGLSLSEYVYLKAVYEKKDPHEMAKIFLCIDRIEEDSLQDRGFIKILPDNKLILREPGLRLFNSGSHFLTYLTMFPIKTPSGRYLSPAGTEGVAVEKIKKKWNSLFKNKPHKEKRAIAVLEAELEWRRTTGQMEYLHNAEAWLNQADYEKFEYLLEEFKSKQDNKRDFM